MRRFLKLSALISLSLVGCETLPKSTGQSCPPSQQPLEGRVQDYFPCMWITRGSPHAPFSAITRFSGIDLTDDTSNRVNWPYILAYAGESASDLQPRIHFDLDPYDRVNNIYEQPPSTELIARISGWKETLPVSYLRRRSDVDMTEEWQTDEYSIALSPTFIDHLIGNNPNGDLSYIGKSFTIEIERPEYETIAFNMNPSEILAAIFVAKSNPSCPADKAPKVTDDYSLKYYGEACQYKADTLSP